MNIKTEINRDDYLDNNNIFSKVWKNLEDVNNYPKRLNKIVIKDFDEFQSKARSQDSKFAEETVSSLLNGDCYILKNALKKDYLNFIKEKTYQYFQNSKSTFHKMYEGVPNYYRFIDASIADNYAFHQVKQVYYFFPFNPNELNLFENANKVWRVTKIISGYNEKIWENNTPKDGIIDRIQIVRYFPRDAKLKLHTDPYLYQRFFISCIMSKKGEDYNEGGLYLLDENDNKIDAEVQSDVGDGVFAVPTIYHGVDPCDLDKTPSAKEKDGRWLLSLYSIMSNYIEDRHTSKPQKISIK